MKAILFIFLLSGCITPATIELTLEQVEPGCYRSDSPHYSELYFEDSQELVDLWSMGLLQNREWEKVECSELREVDAS